MAGVTYKCPSCGAYLAFDPDSGKWKCDFCAAEFDEKTLLAKAEEYAQQAEAETEQATQPISEDSQVIYHCPSCGSEIITDETTVATNCYYCHNPVVLQGKLTADKKPDLVLPFSIGKDKAREQFQKWVKSKRFVPKGFSGEGAEMNGVYYPHFITDCEVDGDFTGEGRNVSVSDTPKYIVTTTRHFAVERRADISFTDIIRPALKSADRKLSDGIHPFPTDQAQPFSSAYLSGFVAERRDLEASEATADVQQELERYVEPLLTKDLPYDSYNGSATCKIKKKKTRYVLLPTWVLTYLGHGKEPYYYAMNGCNGRVCGKLPVDGGKLFTAALLLGLGVAAVMCVLSYLFW